MTFSVKSFLRQYTRGASDFLRWIKTQNKDSIRLIPVEEADYFKAEDKYTLVVTKEGDIDAVSIFNSRGV
jgi:DNA-binding LytR/AlgR family response regulator